MTEQNLEPTDDTVADGTQLPTADELPAEEGDAGVGDVELPEGVYGDEDTIQGDGPSW